MRRFGRCALVALGAVVFGSAASGAMVEVDSDDLPAPSGLPLTIPDNGFDGTLGSMVSHQLTVPEIPGPIESVEIDVFIDHTSVGDLLLRLESPDGTRITLLNRPGDAGSGDAANLTGTNVNFDSGFPITFTDAALTPAEAIGADLGSTDDVVGRDGSPPVSSYQPSADGSADGGLLAAFNGEPVGGTWTLYLADSHANLFDDATGELTRWRLRVTTVPEPASTVVLAIGGLGLAVRRRRRRRGER